MNMKLYSNNIDYYLKSSSIIDYDNEIIADLAKQFNYSNEIELIKNIYEYVRDNIYHSADIMGKVVTYRASDVLKYKEGFCYAKSHLLAALLRFHKIPTGFCYQKLILNDELAPYIILHGLNGVFVSGINKWIRLDARGNKEKVNAQFNLDKEQLAFPIRKELGEEDIPIIYDKPDENVIKQLMKYNKVIDLLNDLPKTLKSY